MQMVALCIREDCCSNDTIIVEQESNCSANNVEPLLLSNYNRIINYDHTCCNFSTLTIFSKVMFSCTDVDRIVTSPDNVG